MSDERQQRIDAADARQLVAQIRREEREAEMREVDDVQQPPAQAEAEPEQAVQAADEDAGQERTAPAASALGSVKRADMRRSATQRHCTCSVAPGAAYSFGQTVTQWPFCTCLTRIRSSP